MTLKPHLSGDDRVVKRAVERHEGPRARVVEKDRIAGLPGIETLPREIELLLLEGGGDLDGVADAHEQGPGVLGQPRREIGAQRGKLQVRFAHDRRHAGATLATVDLYAIHAGFVDARETGDGLGDLGGRDVLALPA